MYFDPRVFQSTQQPIFGAGTPQTGGGFRMDLTNQPSTQPNPIGTGTPQTGGGFRVDLSNQPSTQTSQAGTGQPQVSTGFQSPYGGQRFGGGFSPWFGGGFSPWSGGFPAFGRGSSPFTSAYSPFGGFMQQPLGRPFMQMQQPSMDLRTQAQPPIDQSGAQTSTDTTIPGSDGQNPQVDPVNPVNVAQRAPYRNAPLSSQNPQQQANAFGSRGVSRTYGGGNPFFSMMQGGGGFPQAQQQFGGGVPQQFGGGFQQSPFGNGFQQMGGNFPGNPQMQGLVGLLLSLLGGR